MGTLPGIDGVGRTPITSNPLINDELLSLIESSKNSVLKVSNSLRQRWATAWMLLVGTCYLLRRAEPFVEVSQINYLEVEKIASEIIRCLIEEKSHNMNAVEAEAENMIWKSGKNSWTAGFLLVSAEHRVADVFDRIRVLFEIRDMGDSQYIKPYLEHCKDLNERGCQICKSFKIPYPSDRILGQIGRDDGALNEVYVRANQLKHVVLDKRPPKKVTRIGKLSTARRWRDVHDALWQLTRLFSDLGTHVAECNHRK